VKIGIVSQSYYPKPGGVTEVVHHTAVELRRLGHDATIITTRYNGARIKEPGIIRIGRNILFPANGAVATPRSKDGPEGLQSAWLICNPPSVRFFRP